MTVDKSGAEGLTSAPDLVILDVLRRFENQLAGAFREVSRMINTAKASLNAALPFSHSALLLAFLSFLITS
ncbi:hypothetical protein [Undibacterium sp. Ji49W]|uniref:hypothetical protein n=1 Tax=Undibacterium sp. Ji49W TaxID=3413040 RepID=UPI003BF3A65E